eukprot:364872-Chlamydomonas_euryale.AAC.2
MPAIPGGIPNPTLPRFAISLIISGLMPTPPLPCYAPYVRNANPTLPCYASYVRNTNPTLPCYAPCVRNTNPHTSLLRILRP